VPRSYRKGMKKIMLGYDDTESARHALTRAVEFARAFDASLLVASVAPLLVTAGRGMGAIDPLSDEDEHQRQLQTARELIQAVPGAAVPVEYLTAIGEPVETLVELSDQHDVDLIVLGTREPSMIARLFGQSVSSAVARHAHRDVLIVHGPPQH
jgi:nucleotide-binding universal stress UspA family protein